MTFTYLNKGIARLLIAAVATTFCGLSEAAQAQLAQAPPAQQTDNGPEFGAQSPQQTAPTATPPAATPSGTVDPAAGPLAPVPSTEQQLPSAPSSVSTEQSGQSSTEVPPQKPTWQQPVGAAGAQAGPTAGGAASKPAGNAIAPAKQRQTRSFLIKLGAVAAAGVAIGTVVALSRGTSSNPPGAK